MTDEETFRMMNEEDPWYMGPRCDDARHKRRCVGCRFCRTLDDGSMRCSTSGRKLTERSEACANWM